LYTWPAPYQFSEDLPYNLYKLLVAEALMLPALLMVVLAIIKSSKSKKVSWSILNIVGLITILLLDTYFALPILFPAHGL
jgi:hypothetical protein